MSSLELLQVTLLFALLIASSIGPGYYLTQLFSNMLKINIESKWGLIQTGIYLATGVTIFSYTAMILGIITQFTKTNLLILLTIFLIFSTNSLFALCKELISYIKLIKFQPVNHLLNFVLIALLSTLYLASMQPPHTSDELNYHLPQAQEIVDSHHVDVMFGGHFFYGNIPKMMEILYAAAISISSYQLAHLTHYAFLLAFIAIIYGVMKKLFEERTAVLVSILLLMYDDLTWNMTSGFVDGAAFVMEIAGLLLTLTYLQLKTKKESEFLLYSGITFGIAATIKYSVFITIFYVGMLLLPYLKKEWKNIVIPAVLLGGFWYLKNLFIFGNPFYPLYLGHKGVTPEAYQGLMNAIQQFVPRDWPHFVSKIRYFAELARLPVLISFLAAPLVLLVNKARQFNFLLFVYSASYLGYWFLLGTHQLRFIAPAAMAALILLGIILGRINNFLLLAAAGALAFFMMITPYFDQTVWSYYWGTKLHLVERQYALGNLSKDEFLTREFGCYYQSINYLNLVSSDAVVADNWSQGIEFNVPFYSIGNTFNTADKLDNNDYWLINGPARRRHIIREEDYFKASGKIFGKLDEQVRSSWSLVKTFGDCEIYQKI